MRRSSGKSFRPYASRVILPSFGYVHVWLLGEKEQYARNPRNCDNESPFYHNAYSYLNHVAAVTMPPQSLLYL